MIDEQIHTVDPESETLPEPTGEPEPVEPDFTQGAKELYASCVKGITKAEQAYLDAGKKLWKLQQPVAKEDVRPLYRVGEFKNFNECCQQLWGWDERHARRIIGAWQFAMRIQAWNETPYSERTGPVDRKSPLPLPRNESVARLFLDAYAGEDEQLLRYAQTVALAERRQVLVNKPIVQEVFAFGPEGDPGPPKPEPYEPNLEPAATAPPESPVAALPGPDPDEPKPDEPKPDEPQPDETQPDEAELAGAFRHKGGTVAPPEAASGGQAPSEPPGTVFQMLPEEQRTTVSLWLGQMFPIVGTGAPEFLAEALPAPVWAEVALAAKDGAGTEAMAQAAAHTLGLLFRYDADGLLPLLHEHLSESTWRNLCAMIRDAADEYEPGEDRDADA